MKKIFKILSYLLIVTLFMSGCAKTLQIKVLNPAEVGEMSSKKYIAVSKFKHDSIGLSGKIESKLAKHKLNGKKYFTVLSRKNIDKVIEEQKLQSSELMDEATSVRVGKLIGAQAIINGEVKASGDSDVYYARKKSCVKYVKDKGCVKWRHYQVKCDTTQASISANINIVDIENGSLIYGDTLSRSYNEDSCKSSYVLSYPSRILSKGEALNKLSLEIANSFVYKMTPNYIYLKVGLLEEIEIDSVTDKQEQEFENALAYIEAGRLDRADEILSKLMYALDGKCYVVAYTNGVVKEAQGKLDEAKEFYEIADRQTTEPVDEINLAIIRIDTLIDKRDEVRAQIDVK